MRSLIIAIALIALMGCSRKWNNPVQYQAYPEVPSLSLPANDGWVIGNGATVAWHPSVNATSYRLQISLSSLFATLVVDDPQVKDTCLFVGILDTLHTYWWRVSATNSCDTTVWSEVRYFKPFTPSPSIVYDFSTRDEFWDMKISGDYAYIANGDVGLAIFSLSSAPTMTLVSSLSLPNASSYQLHTRFIVKDAGYVYLLSVRQDLYPSVSSYLDIIDVSNPMTPISVGRCSLASYPYSLDKIGNYIFVATDSIRVIDVSNPLNPSVVTKCDHGYRSMTHSINYLYSTEGSALYIYNASLPQAPVYSGYLSLSANIWEIWAKGSHIFASSYSNSLGIIDISNANSPQIISWTTPVGAIMEIDISSNYLFCGMSGAMASDPIFKIYDISNLKNLQIVYTDGTGHCTAMSLYDKYLILYKQNIKQIIFYKVKR